VPGAVGQHDGGFGAGRDLDLQGERGAVDRPRAAHAAAPGVVSRFSRRQEAEGRLVSDAEPTG
jgi:hypothetical protein